MQSAQPRDSKGARARGQLLAHPQDLHCVVFHGLVLLLYALAFSLHLNAARIGIEGPMELLAFDLGAALLLGWCSGIEVGVNFHNHAHLRIFKRASHNRWFARTWTVSAGWPAYFWQHSHVTVHHRHLLEREDWTLPKRGADGRWEGFFSYSLQHWPMRYARHLWHDLREPVASAQVARRARRELLIFAVLFSIPFWIDVPMALMLWVLPAYLANVLVVGPGMFAQHAGCETPSAEHTYRHSNCFRGRLFNLTMFNIGYHAEHHTHPHTHWSELPELHAQLKPELVADAAHVVPFGYYRAGLLLSRAALGNQICLAEWERQHPDYLLRPQAPQPGPKKSPAHVPAPHGSQPLPQAGTGLPTVADQ